MRRHPKLLVIPLVLLFGFNPAWSASPTEDPLYAHLLNQARDLLAERARKVDSLREPEQLRERSAWVRETLAEAVGGFPDKTPLNAKTVWTKDFGEYKIEGVIFESRPGLHVTANLYLPTSGEGPYPGVLGPCGHDKDAKANEAYQTGWINLARRGFVVLSFDPLGQGERMAFLDKDGKELFWGTTEHTMLGVQSLLLGQCFAREMMWDGIRALDYLIGRPEVDANNIGCTGNSGGGTQTSYFMAIDPRITCAAPSCYITSLRRLFETIGPQDAEQNIPGQVALGIDHADYIEACLPNPVLICAASDDFFDIAGTWETFQEAKNFYGRYGSPERVDLIEAPDTHGYTPPRRTAVYHWFARWLKGEVDEAPEPETEPLTTSELLCTETGQVLTSIPGAKSMRDLYAEQAGELRAVRAKKIESGYSPEWIEEVRKTAGVADRKDLEWRVRPEKPSDPSYVPYSCQTEIEPGWSLWGMLYRPNTETSQNPLLWLQDIRYGDPDSRLGQPLDWVSAGHPVFVFTPRGLDKPDRMKGNQLYEFFGDWPTAFLAMHIDRPLLGQRTEDVEAALSLAVERYPKQKLWIVAEGEAVPPALVAAVADSRVERVILRGGLSSWEEVIAAPSNLDVLSNVAPGMLEVADIPDLVAGLLPRKVSLLSVRSSEGHPLDRESIERIYSAALQRASQDAGTLEILPDRLGD
jgi:cephalosporin-C deacetylase-like acetyl esterase